MPQIAPISWTVMALFILFFLLSITSKMLWVSDFSFPEVKPSMTPKTSWPF